VKTIHVADNLIQLTRLHFVNAYLVREPDGFTLVDTTLAGAADALIAGARAAGAPIRRIALTHGHSDHVGSLDALKNELGDVEVYLGEADARIQAGETVVDGKLRGSWPKKLQTRPDVCLTGGERIGSLEAIPTPGHTPGHMAFLDTRDRTLIAGDTFTSYVRLEVANRLLQPFPLAAMATQDREATTQSARALQALNPACLALGHGPVLKRPAEAMAAAIGRGSGR
jgi:glyoxylase-like metal-dependent hydrolase (beta-lactamase superfamily II)